MKKGRHQNGGVADDVERRQTIGSGGGGGGRINGLGLSGSLSGRRYPTYHCRVESDGARLEVAASGRIVAVRGPPVKAIKTGKTVQAVDKETHIAVPVEKSQEDKDLVIARAQEVLARKSSVRLAQPWRTLGIDRQVERERGWNDAFAKETD